MPQQGQNSKLTEKICSMLCDYKSVRFIKIRNVKLSIAYWIAVVFVALYVLLFTIILEKGYQSTATVSGTTSIKLKGTGSIGNESGPWQDLLPLDAMDLVQPAIEEDAFFVVTSRATTPNQTRQMDCEGNADVPECTAENTTLCNEYLYSWQSQGIFTGNCSANNRCEMYSWCPLENDSNPDIVNGVGDFTAFVKVDINFHAFDVSRNNYYDKYGSSPTDGYNLFSVDEMLSAATDGEVTSASDIAEDGAIVLVTSTWDCNLDHSEEECNPEFSFQRIDGADGTISSGFNFRTITYDTNEESRHLAKLMGIRFVFIAEGTAGKFNFAALTVTLGAGLAYLGVAAIIADLILERFLPESGIYMKQKTRELDGMTPGQMEKDTTDAHDDPQMELKTRVKTQDEVHLGIEIEAGQQR